MPSIKSCLTTIILVFGFSGFSQTFVVDEITKSLYHNSSSKDYGDFNNDGILDLVSYGDDIVVYLGAPNFEFEKGTIVYDTPTLLTGDITCKVGYMNDDNLIDIVINQINPGKIIVLYNNGNGTFTPEIIQLSQNEIFKFVCYDINLDGIDDLFITTEIFSYPLNGYYYDHSYIINSNTNFSQQYAMPSSLGLSTEQFPNLVDVDLDGRKDLQFKTKALLNKPSNPFYKDLRLEELLNVNCLNGVIVDLNQDGRLDYLYHTVSSIRCRFDHGPINGIIEDEVYTNAPAIYNLNNLVIYPDNSNGNPQFLFNVFDSVFKLEYNSVTGVFAESYLFLRPASFSTMKLVDLNLDNSNELVFENSEEIALSIHSGSSFENKICFFYNNSPSGAMCFGDMDNNGLEDYVLYAQGNQLIYGLQTSPGEYAPYQLIDYTYPLYKVDLIDIENDGDKDIVASFYYPGSFSPPNLFNYYLNDGNANFSGPFNLATNFQPSNIQIADVDNNGAADIITWDNTNGGQLSVFKNSNPGFTRTTIASNVYNSSFLSYELVDIDQNNYLDILFTDGNSGSIKCFYNTMGVFASSATSLYNIPGFLGGKIFKFELDNDGDQDIVVTSSDQIFIFENTANSLILKHTEIASTNFLDDLTAMDFDRDNDLDLIYTNNLGLNVMINALNFDFNLDTNIYVGKRLVSFYETRDNLGNILSNYGIDFTNGVFAVHEFISGETPQLINSTIAICPGDIATIQILNGNALNDNNTWSLYADSCDGEFIASNVNGLFNVISNYNRDYYIRATGNADVSGTCAEIHLDVTGTNPVVSVSEIYSDSNKVIVNIVSPTGITVWEYSMDAGVTWNGVTIQNDSLIVQNLSPATVYHFLFRPQGINGICANWASDQLNIETNCETISYTDTVHFCFNEMLSYPNYQQAYATSDTISADFTLLSNSGCDSLIHFVAIAYPHPTMFDTIYACRYTNLTLPDGSIHYIVNAITIPVHLSTINGCDSLINYYVSVLEPSYSDTTVEICQGHEYYWPQTGLTYLVNGFYYDTLVNQLGCDSIITLNLLFTSELIDSIVSSCDTYLWSVNGINYTTSGIYTDTILNSSNCDSIIYILNLTIIPSLPLTIENSFSMPSDVNTCVGEAAITISGNADFELDFDNDSQVITSNGYSLVTGLCAGVHDLHVTDNCGDTLSTIVVIPVDSNYVFNNPFIDSLAQDSLGVTLTNCDIYYNGIDTAYIDSIWANGNTVHVIWNIIDSNGSNFDTTSYVLNNGNGVYWLQLSVFCPNKSLGEYFTVTEAIYFNNGSVSTAGLDDVGMNLFEIYPNPTNDQVHIRFSGSDAELTVYDVQGKVVLKDRIQNNGIISLQNFERGVYLFDFRNSQEQSVLRVVKN